VDVRFSSAGSRHPSAADLAIYCAVLGLAIAPVAVLIAVCAGGLTASALVNAAIGGGVCWLAGALALTAGFVGNRFKAPVQGVLIGMIVRMALPLAALIGFSPPGTPLGANGVATTILGVYLVSLVVETLLSLRMVAPRAGAIEST
jgi:hypothetical protein